MAKSIEKQDHIPPGIYDGRWSAYFVKSDDKNYSFAEFEVDEGVRGINCKCTIEVKEDGYAYVR